MYYERLYDLGIKLTRRSGQEKTLCPQCSNARKNKKDTCLSVNITTGEYHCFSGDTLVLTNNGTKPIVELVGKTVNVLNAERNWVPVLFRLYGLQNLWKIELSRNGRKKTIFSTSQHRWFVNGCTKEVVTEKLLPKQRLLSCFPKTPNGFELNAGALIAGFIFGDGTIYNKHRKISYSKAILFGEKDKFLKQYFGGYKVLEKEDRSTISGFPVEYKINIPSLENGVDYLLSWFAGYFAADGDVANNGVPCINSAKKKDLELVKEILIKCGIGVYGISKYLRSGYGGESEIYRLNIIPKYCIPDIFINPTHRQRFESFEKKYTRARWQVVSVKKTELFEEVFCCEEPYTNSFTLDGNILTGNCHNCSWKGNVRAFEKRVDKKIYDRPNKEMLRNAELKESIINWFVSERKISESTLNKFLIFQKEEFMPQANKKMNCICFPYFRNEELINVKYRTGNKKFKMIKDAELIFYNLNSILEKKRCIITEGEIDAMSVYESGFGKECNPETGEVDVLSEYGVVSVPNGASASGGATLDYLDTCADWFLGMDEIIIATDGDFAGRNLCSELVRRLGVERCKILNYPIDCVIVDSESKMRSCKDLNEVLVNFGKEKVIECVQKAAIIPVDGIYYVDDVIDSMIAAKKRGVIIGETTRFELFDKYFRWKKGDINLCTGYANAGKTYWLVQLMLTKSIYDDWRWAVFSPENYPANDFYDDLIEMYVGKWILDMSIDEYTEAAKFIGEHIFYVYPDHEHDLVTIHEKFRYLILKKGCDGVLLDPWNQLDHNQKKFQREDQYLSECFKDIKRFALLNNICYNIIAHPKNPTYNQDRSLPIADIYDLHGGSAWGNKMDNIMSYHRPLYHENKNSPEAQVWVQKIKRKRTGGEPGYIDLRLVWSKKRFAEMPIEIMPCDPVLAARGGGSYQPRIYNQGWLPYADGGTEINF